MISKIETYFIINGLATKVIFLGLIFLFCSNLANAQGKYSIDSKKLKNRRIPVAYFISESAKELKVAHEWRKRNRMEQRDSRKIRKHTYSIQTKEVKKRMKHSVDKAQRYNEGKIPFNEKIKKLIKWTT